MHISNISIILTIIATSKDFKRNIVFREFAGFLTELALISEFIIITIYWSLLHSEIVKYAEKIAETDPTHAYHYYLLNVFVHIVPGISILLNVIISKIIFVPYHLKYVLLYGMVYCFVNYSGTIIMGEPLYYFLTWEDYWSIVICVAITIPNAIVYYFFCKIIRYLRLTSEERKND